MIGFIPFALPFELDLQTGSAYIGDDWKFEFWLKSEILTKALSSDPTIAPRNNDERRRNSIENKSKCRRSWNTFNDQKTGTESLFSLVMKLNHFLRKKEVNFILALSEKALLV